METHDNVQGPGGTGGKPMILCLSSFFKGNDFLDQCKREGAHVVLLTVENILQKPWVRESIDEVYGILREVAQRNGCAFWETRAAMGGQGSIDRWRKQKPPLANKDHVHLTQEGYRLLATEMVKDLLEAYDGWLSKPMAQAAARP